MFKSGVFITKKSLDNVIARNEVTKQSTLTDEVSHSIDKSESCHLLDTVSKHGMTMLLFFNALALILLQLWLDDMAVF